MTPGGARPTPRRSVSTLAWSAAAWLASGTAAGLVIAGTAVPVIGLPVAFCGVLAAVAMLWENSPPPSHAAATPPQLDEADRISAALGRALCDLDHPEGALREMLRLVAEVIGSRTVLLLALADGDTSLKIEHPAIVDGAVPAEPIAGSLPVSDGGPVRVALAAGVPVAAVQTPEDPGAWGHIAAAHGITSAAIVPLSISNSQLGVLVMAAPGPAITKTHLAKLNKIMPAAGASFGAMLRLRDLAQATAASARTARFRSDYASVVGHELRTPLTTILGVVHTLTRPEMAPENPDARELLQMASIQGRRLKRLVEDMLAINQVDGDGIPIHSELVSLTDLVDRAVDAVSGAAGLTSVNIQESIPPVVLDPEHTKRVLVNLLANAIKYGEDSPIEITGVVDRRDLILTVIDHGPGLPPATAARAFDAFTQLNRTEIDAYGGVGLGLSISQGLVVAMGGTICHTPTEGGGATFTIRLPFKPHAGPRTQW